MMIYLYLFGTILLGTSGFQPNCDPYNQFRYFCFPVEYCESFKCDSDSCGEYTKYTRIVTIQKTKIIPKCAFTNSENLEIIDGRNSEIEVLASGSFVNLTGNLQIDLSFNRIKELHSGIFDNVYATSLNLSWNKILYIQEGALKGLPKLEYLNLSRNALTTFPIHQLPLQLAVLDFSYNLLDRALLTSKRMPSLVFIDFSNNQISKVAFSMENPVKKIDLSNNLLNKFDLIEFPSCEELYIGQNMFSSIPNPLTFLNLKKVSLYPNPWKCNDLQKLWKKLQNNYVDLFDDTQIDNGEVQNPVCSSSKLTNEWSPLLESRNQFTEDDLDCASNMVSRAHHCWEPCKSNVCDTGEVCSVENHKLSCVCPKGTNKDPMRPYSGCQNVECFTDSHCSENSYCDGDNKCKAFQALSTQRPIPAFHPYSSLSDDINEDISRSSGLNGPPKPLEFNRPSHRVTTPPLRTTTKPLRTTRPPEIYRTDVTDSNQMPATTEFIATDKDDHVDNDDEWWRYEIPKSLKEQNDSEIV